MTDQSDDLPICFVVMGFGKKTDFESGRLLDLDKSYENIIQPAAQAAGYRVIRADDIWHSSIIDAVMYEMLFRADLVIADISTANPNALYELGVRHAMRPHSTIVMKEEEGRYFFDLDHLNTFNYRHLGEDIGASEAKRAQADLEKIIRVVSTESKIDSPVYTYLPKLVKPQFSDEEFAELVDQAEARQEHIAELLKQGEECIEQSSFDDALLLFARVHVLRPNEPYIIQRMVLSRYKSKLPSELTALTEALVMLAKLNPHSTNDPETLGLAGAIYKRLFWLTNDRPQLDMAIQAYRRGYEFKRDYYNGENLALCYDYRSSLQSEPDEALYDKLSAKKARESIFIALRESVSDTLFSERLDQKWIYATLSNVAYALGHADVPSEYESMFRGATNAQWEHDTFEKSRAELRKLGY